ncbi:Oxidoreductase2C short-chain dehydrogenase/reductase family [gamma proteobacterium IMCC2047]|nr:Oxidoreductase2C short-chain dehydrogenase/reductase family [gamma proteobacterium IMCC2047]
MNILITGATSGIGKQLAEKYLAQHNQVICCGRNEEALQKLRNKYGKQVTTYCFDITDYEAVQLQLAEIHDLDLAILNAGTCEYLDMPEFDARSYQRVLTTNVQGVANCLEAVIPKIKPNGRLALVGSSASYLPLPRAEAYGASKAAIEYLAKTLMITLKPYDIQVSLLCPGFVKTPLTDQNDFPMPMRINADKAAVYIISGLAKGKAEIHFPRRFTGILKLLGKLPFSLQRPIISGLVSRH